MNEFNINLVGKEENIKKEEIFNNFDFNYLPINNLPISYFPLNNPLLSNELKNKDIDLISNINTTEFNNSILNKDLKTLTFSNDDNIKVIKDIDVDLLLVGGGGGGAGSLKVETSKYITNIITTNQQFYIPKNTLCDILLVGGGGGGGRYDGIGSFGDGGGGGGGGGEVVYIRKIFENGINLNVIIGKGGDGATKQGNGKNGENTSIIGNGISEIAYGGGGGGGGEKGNDGGNGGGGGGNNTDKKYLGGKPIRNVKYIKDSDNIGFKILGGENGGYGLKYAGGGGSGSGSVPFNLNEYNNGNSISGGNGGAGYEVDITGNKVRYGGGGGGSSGRTSIEYSYGYSGIGGDGGGGNSGNDYENEKGNGRNGIENTGGGGGGGKSFYNKTKPNKIISGNGGNGGSGIVIIRYTKFESNKGSGGGGEVIYLKQYKFKKGVYNIKIGNGGLINENGKETYIMKNNTNLIEAKGGNKGDGIKGGASHKNNLGKGADANINIDNSEAGEYIDKIENIPKYYGNGGKKDLTKFSGTNYSTYGNGGNGYYNLLVATSGSNGIFILKYYNNDIDFINKNKLDKTNIEKSGIITKIEETNYSLITFNDKSQLKVNYDIMCDILIVDGGNGGNGVNSSGNGNAGLGGNVKIYENYNLKSGTYDINVGVGGSGGIYNMNGKKGSISSIKSIPNNINLLTDTGSDNKIFNGITYGNNGGDGGIINIPSIIGGGIMKHIDGSIIIIFNSSGNITFSKNIERCDILIVGGGGGGGNGIDGADEGGGGGAGGVVYKRLSLSKNTYTIIVGDGGNANTNGNNSSISYGDTTIGTGIGGGAGGSMSNGKNGGSGGGASFGYNLGGSSTQPNTLSSDIKTINFIKGGNNGSYGEYSRGGGGGGAGGNADNIYGGIGVNINITGSNLYYAGGGNSMVAHNMDNVECVLRYNLGGGGRGCSGNGTNNTGGGGGGGYKYKEGGTGGKGGSGVVIMRIYLTSEGNGKNGANGVVQFKVKNDDLEQKGLSKNDIDNIIDKDTRIINDIKDEFRKKMKFIENNDMPYNKFSILPLVILILLIWIFIFLFLLKFVHHYFANIYLYILLSIIILLLLFGSLWFLYSNNDL
jgi:hypothetical protein